MTLATSALKTAKYLGRVNAAGTSITDLETEIKEEIGETIRFYNRQKYALTEVRGFELTTVAGRTWYSSVNLSAGSGDQDVTGRTAVDANQIVSIHYAREGSGGNLDDSLLRLSYEKFEKLFEGVTPQSSPSYFTYYAGQIGLWPTPNAVYTIYMSGVVKGVVPVSDGDTSIWLTEAEEMITTGAAKRVASKYTRNDGLATRMAMLEESARSNFARENAMKQSSGRIKAHY